MSVKCILINQIASSSSGDSNSSANVVAYEVTLSASDWIANGSGYIQTVGVDGVTAADSCIVDIEPEDGLSTWQFGITKGGQGAGVVSFAAEELPDIDLTYIVTVTNADLVLVTDASSITAYNVTLLSTGWTEGSAGYIQIVNLSTVTDDDACIVIANPIDGNKAWQYGIAMSEQGNQVLTFSASSLPAEDVQYKISVLNPSLVYVDALAEHNTDPAAHANIELEVTE